MIIQIEDKSYHLLKDEDKELISQIINDPTRSLNAGGIVYSGYKEDLDRRYESVPVHGRAMTAIEPIFISETINIMLKTLKEVSPYWPSDMESQLRVLCAPMNKERLTFTINKPLEAFYINEDKSTYNRKDGFYKRLDKQKRWQN